MDRKDKVASGDADVPAAAIPPSEAFLDDRVNDFLALTKLDLDLSATVGFTTLQLAELYLQTVSLGYVEEFNVVKDFITKLIRDKKINVSEQDLEYEINNCLQWITGKLPRRVAAVRKCAALLFSGQLQAAQASQQNLPATSSSQAAVLSPPPHPSDDLHATADKTLAAPEEITLKDIRDAWDRRTVLLQKLDEVNHYADECAAGMSKLKCSMKSAKCELNAGNDGNSYKAADLAAYNSEADEEEDDEEEVNSS